MAMAMGEVVATKDTITTIDETAGEQYIVEPFPTTYWLICPSLKALISKLESNPETSVTAMEKRLSRPDNAADSRRFVEANKSTGEDRWSMLSEAHKEEVTRRNWKSLFPDRGIGGMPTQNVEGGCVKCMHMQYGDYVGLNHGGEGAAENVVGKWTEEMLTDLREIEMEKEKATKKIVSSPPFAKSVAEKSKKRKIVDADGEKNE